MSGPDQDPHVVNHIDGHDLTAQKNQVCTHKEAFPRKVYRYENVCHRWVYVSMNFQINILIGY